MTRCPRIFKLRVHVRMGLRSFTHALTCLEHRFELEHVGQDLEETENIEVEVVTESAFIDRVKTGAIQDGKTLAAFFLYQLQRE